MLVLHGSLFLSLMGATDMLSRPTFSVVIPCMILGKANGSSIILKSEWLWLSMKPGTGCCLRCRAPSGLRAYRGRTHGHDAPVAHADAAFAPGVARPVHDAGVGQEQIQHERLSLSAEHDAARQLVVLFRDEGCPFPEPFRGWRRADVRAVDVLDAELAGPGHVVLEPRAEPVAHRPHGDGSVRDMCHFVGSEAFLEGMVSGEDGFGRIADVEDCLRKRRPRAVDAFPAFGVQGPSMLQRGRPGS